MCIVLDRHVWLFGMLSSTLGTCMQVRAPCATKTMAPLIEQVAQLPVGDCGVT